MSASLLIAVGLLLSTAPEPLLSKWHGYWQGTLLVQSPGKPKNEVPISISIKPLPDATRFTWHITYGDGDKKSVRPYEMVSMPDGQFELDEKSGIRMKMTMIDNKLFCLFKTGQSLLHVTYERQGEFLNYTITSYQEKDSLKTEHEKSKQLTVDSYKLLSVQSAQMKNRIMEAPKP